MPITNTYRLEKTFQFARAVTLVAPTFMSLHTCGIRTLLGQDELHRIPWHHGVSLERPPILALFQILKGGLSSDTPRYPFHSCWHHDPWT